MSFLSKMYLPSVNQYLLHYPFPVSSLEAWQGDSIIDGEKLSMLMTWKQICKKRFACGVYATPNSKPLFRRYQFDLRRYPIKLRYIPPRCIPCAFGVSTSLMSKSRGRSDQWRTQATPTCEFEILRKNEMHQKNRIWFAKFGSREILQNDHPSSVAQQSKNNLKWARLISSIGI